MCHAQTASRALAQEPPPFLPFPAGCTFQPMQPSDCYTDHDDSGRYPKYAGPRASSGEDGDGLRTEAMEMRELRELIARRKQHAPPASVDPGLLDPFGRPCNTRLGGNVYYQSGFEATASLRKLDDGQAGSSASRTTVPTAPSACPCTVVRSVLTVHR